MHVGNSGTLILLMLAAGCGGGDAATDPGAGTSRPQFLYSVSSSYDGKSCVLVQKVDAATGALHPVESVPTDHSVDRLARHPSGRFLYATAFDAEIAMFRLDATTGRPELFGYTPQLIEGGHPTDIRMHASGRFVYALFERFNAPTYLHAFAVDENSGMLERRGNPVTVGPVAFAFDRSGRYLHTFAAGLRATLRVEGDGTLTDIWSVSDYTHRADAVQACRTRDQLYSVSGATGELRTYRIDASGQFEQVGASLQVTPPSFYARSSLVLDPTDRFAYVGQRDRLVMLRLDATTGAPTLVDTRGAWELTRSLAVDDTGTFLYTGGDWNGTTLFPPGISGSDIDFHIGAYRIDRSQGLLEWVGCSRVGQTLTDLAVGVGAPAVATYPQRLYVANRGSDDISMFELAADGSLRSRGQVVVGSEPVAIAAEPVRRVLYVACRGSSQVLALHAAANGDLQPVGSPVDTGAGLAALAVDPCRRILVTASTDANEVRWFTIDPATGALTPLGSMPQDQPVALAINPLGECVHVLRADGTVTSNAIGYGPQLQPSTSLATGMQARQVFVDPTGLNVYLADTVHGDVGAFRIHTYYESLTWPPYFESRVGNLTSLGATVDAGVAPTAIAAHPLGQFVFVANSGSDDVRTFRRDRATGTLVAVGTPTAAGDAPIAIALDASGRFAYVASQTTGEVRAFRVQATTGELFVLGTPAIAGSLPTGMVVLGP